MIWPLQDFNYNEILEKAKIQWQKLDQQSAGEGPGEDGNDYKGKEKIFKGNWVFILIVVMIIQTIHLLKLIKLCT